MRLYAEQGNTFPAQPAKNSLINSLQFVGYHGIIRLSAMSTFSPITSRKETPRMLLLLVGPYWIAPRLESDQWFSNPHAFLLVVRGRASDLFF